MESLNSLRSDMANVWRVCNKGNAEALRLFEMAEAAAREQDEIFRGDFVNQMMRKDNCIPREELVPALLSEDSNTVATFWAVLGDSERVSAKEWAATIVRDAAKEGFDILSIKDQLYTMGWPRPMA